MIGGVGLDWMWFGGIFYVLVYRGLGLVGNLAFIVGGCNIGFFSWYGFLFVYWY